MAGTNHSPRPEEARRHLEKILTSEPFRQSPRLSSFLGYVVNRAIEGKHDEISEYAIAIDVFGRDDSFDSRVDSIVRVSARQLRTKLARYYETEGADDRIEIRIPTPGYAPVLVAKDKRGSPGVAAVVGVILALAAAAALVGWTVTRPGHGSANQPVIAVLPLRALSPEPADQLFGESLTEEITTRLAGLEGVSVISHTAGLAGKNPIPLDYLLEGAVARSEMRMRLTARLTTAGGQRLAWGESFERTLDDPLTAQRELSRKVAAAVAATLNARQEGAADQPARAAVPQTYLLGKALMHQWTPESLGRSAEYFAQAMEANPDFAPAYAGYAMTLRILSFMAPGAQNEPLRRAREAAERAVALDDTLAEAHASLGGSEVFDHRWEKGERRFQKAIELDPGYALARHMYALLCLVPLGRLEEAEQQMRKAIELQPLSVSSRLGLAHILYFRGRHDEAIRQLEHTQELGPNSPTLHRFLGQVYLALERQQQAIDSLRLAHQMTNAPTDLGLLAHAHGVAGHENEVRQILQSLRSNYDAESRSPWSLAAAHAGIGNDAQALRYLRAACERRDAWALSAPVDPMFDRLRALPGFQDVRTALGLPQPHGASK